MGSIKFENIVIEHLGHAAFKLIGNERVVYIDPFQIKGAPHDGHVVICTHDHYDHCSLSDIVKVIREGGVIVAAENCRGKLKGVKADVKLLKPGEECEILGLKIRAVPAYNVGKPYHPKRYGGIGVVVEIEGVRVYHAGDTDLIPEMSELKGTVDVALLPVSGVYVMNVEQAVKAAKEIGPKLAIPMHYGSIVGSVDDAERFKEALEGICEVAILL